MNAWSLAALAIAGRCSGATESMMRVMAVAFSIRPVSIRGGRAQAPASRLNSSLRANKVSMAIMVVRAIQRATVSRGR
ncbi:hypothetical protein D3C76_1558430 [compost metagenome]